MLLIRSICARSGITDKEALARAMQGVDYVFHLAALASVPRSVNDPLGNNEHNVTGTLNVLLTARDAGVKRVVYAGSSSAYGNIESEFKSEDMPPQPLSPYAVAKLAANNTAMYSPRSMGWKQSRCVISTCLAHVKTRCRLTLP